MTRPTMSVRAAHPADPFGLPAPRLPDVGRAPGEFAAMDPALIDGPIQLSTGLIDVGELRMQAAPKGRSRNHQNSQRRDAKQAFANAARRSSPVAIDSP